MKTQERTDTAGWNLVKHTGEIIESGYSSYRAAERDRRRKKLPHNIARPVRA